MRSAERVELGEGRGEEGRGKARDQRSGEW